MKCGECETKIDMGYTFKRNDFNMFTNKPMVSIWYVCINENCGVSLPMRGE